MYNYINLRWKDGYDFFSDSDHLIERYNFSKLNSLARYFCESISHRQEPVIQFTYSREFLSHVLLFKTSLYDMNIERRVSYFHVIIIRDEHQVYSSESLIGVFQKVYGEDIQSSVENICSTLSITRKNDKGRELLRRYFLKQSDISHIPEVRQLSPQIQIENISSGYEPQEGYFIFREIKTYILNLWSHFSPQYNLDIFPVKKLLLTFLVLALSLFLWRTISHTAVTDRANVANSNLDLDFRTLYLKCLEGELEGNKFEIQRIESSVYAVSLYCEARRILVNIYPQRDIIGGNTFISEVVLKNTKEIRSLRLDNDKQALFELEAKE